MLFLYAENLRVIKFLLLTIIIKENPGNNILKI